MMPFCDGRAGGASGGGPCGWSAFAGRAPSAGVADTVIVAGVLGAGVVGAGAAGVLSSSSSAYALGPTPKPTTKGMTTTQRTRRAYTTRTSLRLVREPSPAQGFPEPIPLGTGAAGAGRALAALPDSPAGGHAASANAGAHASSASKPGKMRVPVVT